MAEFTAADTGYAIVSDGGYGARILSRSASSKSGPDIYRCSFSAQLFNDDLRRDQQYMAEHGLFPCGSSDESRFAPSLTHNLSSIEIAVHGSSGQDIQSIDLTHEWVEHLGGNEKFLLDDLFSLIEMIDPQVILFPDADIWMPRIVKKAHQHGIPLTISRTGRFRRMDSRSYWSYGKMEHKEGAVIPDGRILIDTSQSFVYREGGLEGVLIGSRLSGLSPNHVSRFTPGTLISSYEVYGALASGIVVPFRKSDAEKVRTFSDLRACDKGGMMFQPKPGVYAEVYELDYTSLYPSIIVQSNLSPETIEHPPGTAGVPCSGSRPVAADAYRDEAAQEAGPVVCRYRLDPEVDAGHLFWLYRVQEREVRQD